MKRIAIIPVLLLLIIEGCTNKQQPISNQFLNIDFPLTEKALWSYTLTETGESISFKAPEFEIDGKILNAVTTKLVLLDVPDTLKNGVVEYKLKGTIVSDTTYSLKVVFRLSPKSPVVRFCYHLESKLPHRFTKIQGKDSLSYFTAGFQKFQTFSEIRLSDFNEKFHSFNLKDQAIDERYFENKLSVTGPILVAENASSTFLIAYEHGSQIPDRFIEFGLNSAKDVVLKAVKGNYYNNQPLDASHPFETIWFEAAGIKGTKHEMAKHYRNFVLNDLAVNTSSRTPYIYYNTWGFQERDKCWNGNKYLSSLNLKHAIQEINIAHQLGVDVFVLDAGWFSKTGDWRANTNFFPDSLRVVKATLDSLNMKLGLWYSPTQAAVTSSIYKNNPNSRTSYNGEKSQASEVWETEASYNMCVVNNYWKDCAAQMIQNAHEYGNIYFKWDAIYQYGCNDPNHFHGTAENSEQERLDCYAFELCRYLNKIVDSVSAVVPEAIVDFDVTEGWRSMGLQFLASGKYFLMNNGPYYGNYDLPMSEKIKWNNIFVYPGPARARICRSPLSYDEWIPSILFLTHYLPDAPESSQTINVASLILGQNGFWGDLLSLKSEGIQHIGGLIEKYKQVKNDITVSYPVVTGEVGSLPEVHEKVNEANGKGAVVIFSEAAKGHKFVYVTKNKVDRNVWFNSDVSVTFDDKGRAVITCEFKDEAAKIVFFGVK